MSKIEVPEILSCNNVAIYYQPILCNKTKQLFKYEALMRLKYDGKILLPDEFMQRSKDFGAYAKLSEKMVKKVFEDLRRFSLLQVSINVSMLNIINIPFCKLLFNQIRSIKNPGRVTIEFIETDKMDFGKALCFLSEMKKLGVKISIDDFGTGYSNFDSLMQADFDYLKIDGGIIKNISLPKSETIVSSILHYCREHDVKIVAEHVETEEIQRKVCSMGIDYSQGFYIGEPSASLICKISR
ncbi:MAG: hypothetical protein QG567_1967 [Campylobacterota bacterium]|nr:hypothetical protein [Campylobacterota bacterium]